MPARVTENHSADVTRSRDVGRGTGRGKVSMCLRLGERAGMRVEASGPSSA